MLTVSRFFNKRERAVADLIIKMDPTFHLSQTIWSSTKNLTALAMACLVDRGLLSYSDKYSQHQEQDKTIIHSTNYKICKNVLPLEIMLYVNQTI